MVLCSLEFGIWMMECCFVPPRLRHGRPCVPPACQQFPELFGRVRTSWEAAPDANDCNGRWNRQLSHIEQEIGGEKIEMQELQEGACKYLTVCKKGRTPF